MRRLCVSFLCCLGLAVTGYSVQPPAEDEPPPVRLKKKERKPAAEPEKPADPVKPPDKPVDPVKPKPKLDDDDRLDRKDDLKQPPPENEDNDILERVAKNARVSEDKLANQEVGEGTRQIQRDILDDLDKLLKQA